MPASPRNVRFIEQSLQTNNRAQMQYRPRASGGTRGPGSRSTQQSLTQLDEATLDLLRLSSEPEAGAAVSFTSSKRSVYDSAKLVCFMKETRVVSSYAQINSREFCSTLPVGVHSMLFPESHQFRTKTTLIMHVQLLYIGRNKIFQRVIPSGTLSFAFVLPTAVAECIHTELLM
ncbi:unnamed protein product [Haemonchus placei]|uniref:Uncharacterized protein n=1 Tax=Haemonchus placei TaxID=6290 RepID=A0A0N4XBW9_HAEPC|nr:unnamed protein product [Haemonchus placei]